MFAWMAWTLPVAVFFGCIVLMLAGMTLWELRSPTLLRKAPVRETGACGMASGSQLKRVAPLAALW